MPITECRICKASFYVKPSHQKLGWGKYCSVQCRIQAQFHGKKVHCLICNEEVYKSLAQIRHSKSGNLFCSKSCQTKWRNSYFIEEKHPNWLGGMNTYRNILIRSGVKQVCVCCKIEDVRVLAAHHIDHNRENNRQSNLVWVCLNCHYLIHHDSKFEVALRERLEKE